MKFLVSATLFAFAAANPLASRDAPTVLADIKTLSADTVKLNDSITQVGDGSGFAALASLLAVENNANTVSDDTNKTVQAVNGSPTFTQAESGQIAQAVLNFVPTVNSTIDNLIAHKDAIQKASFNIGSSLVVSDLQKIKGLAAQLGTGLGQKLSAPYNSFAPQISGQIQAIFDRAIAAYGGSSTGGSSPFPGFPSPAPGGSPFPGFPSPSPSGGSPFPGFPSK